jgi:hypothetical protein
MVIAQRRMTANVAVPFQLPTWTIHPTDLAAFAGKSVRFFFQAANAQVRINVAQCVIEYTTDARVPWTLAWRQPNPTELQGIRAGLNIGVAGFAAAGPFGKFADYNTPGTPPVGLGYENQPTLLPLPPPANADATYYDIVVADVPATTDPNPLLEAGLKFYRKGVTGGSTYLNRIGVADVRFHLFDRNANTIVGSGSRVRDTNSMLIPQQLLELQTRQFRAGRSTVIPDGIGDDIFPASAATWQQTLAHAEPRPGDVALLRGHHAVAVRDDGQRGGVRHVRQRHAGAPAGRGGMHPGADVLRAPLSRRRVHHLSGRVDLAGVELGERATPRLRAAISVHRHVTGSDGRQRGQLPRVRPDSSERVHRWGRCGHQLCAERYRGPVERREALVHPHVHDAELRPRHATG